LLILIWVVAGAVRHAIFLFLVALLIALLLNPLVRGLGRARIPRGLAVALVYLAFAAVVAVAVIGLATVVVQQTRHASHRIDNYFTVASGHPPQTGANRDLARFQHWLNRHHLRRIQVERSGKRFLDSIGTKDVEKYTTKALNWAEGAGLAVVTLLFSTLLVVVVSIYMLLDMPRLKAAVDRRFPPYPGNTPLLERMEQAIASYVKGQLLLSLIIGASSGLGLWILGLAGALPHGGRYALLFGAWAGVTELVPYVGPWLGAIPPVLYALITDPIAALWVALLYLGIQQAEGHLIVPNLLGRTLRLHPLLVIFGLLAGAEIYGFPGIVVSLPLLAAARAAWEFFSERVELETWDTGEPVAVDVELVPTEAPPAPPAPPAPASS
ncbi:MAG: AI-2E family transporter, partial [Acidobacteriota bacterium]|nr:AI-2E family transporter [Acidobacteriota bacterium]